MLCIAMTYMAGLRFPCSAMVALLGLFQTPEMCLAMVLFDVRTDVKIRETSADICKIFKYLRISPRHSLHLYLSNLHSTCLSALSIWLMELLHAATFQS